MSTIPYRQATIVYEDAMLDTEEIIGALLAEGRIREEEAAACRALSIENIDSFDGDAEVTITHTHGREVYYSARGYDGDRVWSTDGSLDAGLREFFLEIGRGTAYR